MALGRCILPKLSVVAHMEPSVGRQQKLEMGDNASKCNTGACTICRIDYKPISKANKYNPINSQNNKILFFNLIIHV